MPARSRMATCHAIVVHAAPCPVSARQSPERRSRRAVGLLKWIAVDKQAC